MRSLILGSILVLAPILLPAQPDNSAIGTNTAATTPASVDQAPDVVLQKLRDLIDVGKYPEAQQMASGLLAAYPDDPRLTKAKILLDKLVAQQSASATPVTSQSGNNATLGSPADQLTGMDKVDYNALIQRAREAQQTKDLDQQKTLLRQFMVDSSQFLQKHPEQMLIWQFRAVSAISLDDMLAGNEAGQKLLSMGAANSNDPNLQQLLAQLKNKGWFDQQKVKYFRININKIKNYSWLLGTWKAQWIWKNPSWMIGSSDPEQQTSIFRDRLKEEFYLSDSNIEGRVIRDNGDRCAPDLRGVILDSGKIKWECYLPPYGSEDQYTFRSIHSAWNVDNIAERAGIGDKGYLEPDGFNKKGERLGSGPFYPAGWMSVMSSIFDQEANTIQIVVPSQIMDPRSNVPVKYPVTTVFTKIAD